MYRKVLAIIKEINDKTMKPKAAQATLDAIAQEALKSNDVHSKKMADFCLALIPLVESGLESTVTTNLELLAFSLAKPTIERLEKKLCERYGYDFNDIEKLRDDGTITEHFTPNMNILVWLCDGWSDRSNRFKTEAVAFLHYSGDGSDLKVVTLYGDKELCDITAMVDMVLA